MENQVVEKKVKAPRVKLTPEEAKVNRAANGVAAKQFFIHKSLFKEAEEIMAPILAKSKEIVAQNA